MKHIWNAIKSIFVNDAHSIISERGKEILAEQQHQREMKREMKQTAVDWYENEINALFDKYENKEISKSEFLIMKHNLFYPAKEMEKEQMIDWYATGQADTVNMYEQHLNKTFNTDEK